MQILIKANGSVPNCFLPIGFKLFFNSCTCRPYICHIYVNISSANWHNKKQRKTNLKLVKSLGSITSNSRVWVFRNLTFDQEATNNILIPAITPKNLQPQKAIQSTSRNTNCDTKLGEKQTSKCQKKITYLNLKPYFGLHPLPRGQVMQ